MPILIASGLISFETNSICFDISDGGIETIDEHGQDDKIICILDPKVDKEYVHINNYNDIPKQKLDQIIYFLSHYKDNDGKKFIKIGDVYDKTKALQFIEKSKL